LLCGCVDLVERLWRRRRREFHAGATVKPDPESDSHADTNTDTNADAYSDSDAHSDTELRHGGVSWIGSGRVCERAGGL